MSRKIESFAKETLKKLPEPGLLLVSANKKGKANVMTIGWGLIGVVWRKPMFLVLVRPSRFTHQFIEETDEFTVNVPAEGMEKTVAYCGEVSGRKVDKFKKCELTVSEGRRVKVPVVAECTIHYECNVVHKLQVDPTLVPMSVNKLFYSKGNFHTLYFGEIKTVY